MVQNAQQFPLRDVACSVIEAVVFVQSTSENEIGRMVIRNYHFR
jgi:hypothetical protein